ncbi:MAG: GGDEF domain-containing protein [Actinobacteria bacterium]|nr:GGDEF domain-containing protein [Actinomycetota bacterium]
MNPPSFEGTGWRQARTLPTYLREISSVAFLLLDESGLVVDCSSHAWRLLTFAEGRTPPFELRGILVRPSLAEIVQAGSGASGRVTVGAWTGMSRSLTYRLADTEFGLMLSLERDLAAVEGSIANWERLNREAVAAQRRSVTLRAKLQENEKRLRNMAFTDTLTGLATRRAFDLELDLRVASARDEGNRQVLAIIDIDKFKQVNDLQGHHVGDVVLGTLGELIRKYTRATDTASRIGGDELAIFLERNDSTSARRVVERLLSSVTAQQWAAPISVTISVGIAELRPDDDATSWFVAADHSLYAAKQAGGNCWRERGFG